MSEKFVGFFFIISKRWNSLEHLENQELFKVKMSTTMKTKENSMYRRIRVYYVSLHERLNS